MAEARTQVGVSAEVRLHRIYQDSHTHSWNGPDVVRKASANRPLLDVDTRNAIASFLADMRCVERSSWDAFLRLATLLPSDEARMAATAQAADEANHFVTAREYLRGLDLDEPPADGHLVAALNRFTPSTAPLDVFYGLSLVFEEAISSMFRQIVRADADIVLTKVGYYYIRDEARHTYFASLYLPALLASAPEGQAAAARASCSRHLTEMTAWLAARSETLSVIGIDTDLVRQEVVDGLQLSLSPTDVHDEGK